MNAGSLASVAVGSTARVGSVEGDPVLVARLTGMGLLPGVEIRVVKRAPFGDPVLVEFESQQLSLRRAEAEAVVLE